MTTWKDKLKKGAQEVGRRTSDTAGKVASSTTSGAKRIGDATSASASYVSDKAHSAAKHTRDQAGIFLAFLHTKDLLKWTESVTDGPGSIYDKAMDAEYIRTHIGGGDHRLFDGGHDLVTWIMSTWQKFSDMI